MALVERLQILIETVGAGKAAGEFQKIGGAAKGLAGQVKSGKFSLDGLAQTAGVTTGMLKTGLVGAAVAGAGALVSLGQKGVDAFTGLAEQIMVVQRVTGASAEDSSRLVAIADDLGVSVESVAGGMTKLGKNIGALPSLGVKVATDAQGVTSLTGTLVNLADAYVATSDPAKRLQLVTGSLGKSGTALIPILERGGQGIRDMYAAADQGGLIMSQADLDTARTFSLVMDQLADTIQGGLVSVGRELLPILIDIGVIMDKLKGSGDGLAGTVGTAVKGYFQWMTGAGLLVGALDLLAGKEGDARESATAAKAASDEQAASMDELTKTTLGLVSADRAVEAAGRDVAAAHRGLADAQKDLNKLHKDGAVDEEKVADARRSLADATRSAADADRGLTKAQGEYADALAEANLLGSDTNNDKLAEAAEGLADAQDTAASAHERAQEAAKDLKAAQAGDPEFQDKLADARQKVADNTQRVADAEYNLSRETYEAAAAHTAEATAIAGKADEVIRLRAELETMLALNPALQAFLGPLIGALDPGPGVRSPVLGTTGGLLGGLGTPLPGSGQPMPSTASTTNNVWINAVNSDSDAKLIAKEVMWNLN